MSNSEFRDVFDLFVSTTDEYSQLLPLLEESVLSRLARTDALLDVGAGPGLITLPLSTHFDHIGIVEPDPVYCLEAARKGLSTGKMVTAFSGAWHDAHFGEQQFDLIVCAHVLYFVAEEEWDRFIQKMVPLLAPGGRIAIVMVTKSDGTNELIRRVLGIEEVGDYPFSAAVIANVQVHGYGFELLSFEANIIAETAEQMLDVLVLFPLVANDVGSSRDERLALIENHFKEAGHYRMPYVVDVVVIEAPG